jgi:Raf kinase inhibitor-like YbhB/YbcL family protein
MPVYESLFGMSFVSEVEFRRRNSYGIMQPNFSTHSRRSNARPVETSSVVLEERFFIASLVLYVSISLRLGNFLIRIPAFGPSGRMSKRYAGDGDNLSPPLEWSGAPRSTKQFALICHDPDAPLPHGFTHWVVCGIPESVTKLAEGQKPDVFTPGVNGRGKPGYAGPYPPSGHGVHHYYFWVYALDEELKLENPSSASPFLFTAILG